MGKHFSKENRLPLSENETNTNINFVFVRHGYGCHNAVRPLLENGLLSKKDLHKFDLKDPELNKILEGTGYKSSLFGFKTSFIKNAGSIIYKDWSRLPYLSVNLIEGLRLSGIYSEYESKLK